MGGNRQWFFLSGALSVSLVAFAFFVLIVAMFYTPPVVRPVSVESFAISLEIESFHALSHQEPTPVAQAGEPVKGVRDLFGEINASVSDESMHRARRPLPSAPAMPRVMVDGQPGHTSRTPTPQLQLEQIAPLGGSPKEQSATAVSTDAPLQDHYLAEIHRRLSSAWHPGHGDLDKMAMIEMRISRQGVVSYRIVRIVRGDAPFEDRLVGALDRIRAEGVPPPERPLVLNVNFIVKE